MKNFGSVTLFRYYPTYKSLLSNTMEIEVNCIYLLSDVRDCGDVSCSGNGICYEDQRGGISCICDNGYTGAVCDLNIDECLSEPCKNQGLCKDQVNDYKCECGINHVGDHCEKRMYK